MSKMLRLTEAEFHARTFNGVSRKTPSQNNDGGAAGRVCSEVPGDGPQATEGCADEIAHTQGGGVGLVMLPYPISANRYWRNFKGRMVVSSEALEYKKQVVWTFNALGVEPVWSDVALTMKLHPKLTTKGKASRTLIDLDNCIKVCLDALQGVLYVNDKQVKKLTAEIGEPVDGGGLSVGII